MRPVRRSFRRYAACLFLAALVLAPYRQVGGHAFLSFDDNGYVYENPQVLRGLSMDGAAWAFTTVHRSNWHPLTWLSHMADVELFGLDAGRHHLVNVSFHAANAILLFLVLHAATGAFWRSGFVAALFAVHPLHVESVAWVAERKDLLCAMFWILSMGAYVAYVRRPGAWRFLPVAALFALGLMCKPMIVTLPFVLLLLDAWPLGRFGAGSSPWAALPRLVGEKVPLLLLSSASVVATLLAQRGAIGSAELFPAGARISNAAISYAAYLGKTVWPVSLAAFYPHHGFARGAAPVVPAAASALLLAAATVLAVRQRRRRPFLAVGWLWYLGTLVPVIGLVQVGFQAMADRYTYLPLIGIFACVAWSVPHAPPGRRLREAALGAAGGAVLLALAATTWVQAGYWKDNVTLFAHAARVTEGNWLAWNSLGDAYSARGQDDRAVPCYREAVRFNPGYLNAWISLGTVLSRTGRDPEAIECFRTALMIDPNHADAHYNLGILLYQRDRPAEAARHFAEVLRLNPADPFAARILDAIRSGR